MSQGYGQQYYNNQPNYAPQQPQQPQQQAPPKKKSGCFKFCMISCVVLLLLTVGASVGAYYFLKTLPKRMVQIAKMHPAYKQTLRSVSEIPAVKKSIGTVKDVSLARSSISPKGFDVSLKVKGEKANGTLRAVVGPRGGNYTGTYGIHTLQLKTSDGKVLDFKKVLVTQLNKSKGVKDLVKALNKSPTVGRKAGRVIGLADLPFFEVSGKRGGRKGRIAMTVHMNTARGRKRFRVVVAARKNLVRIDEISLGSKLSGANLVPDIIKAMNKIYRPLLDAANSSPKVRRAVGRVRGFASLPWWEQTSRVPTRREVLLVARVRCAKGKARLAMVMRDRVGPAPAVYPFVLITSSGKRIPLPYDSRKLRNITRGVKKRGGAGMLPPNGPGMGTPGGPGGARGPDGPGGAGGADGPSGADGAGGAPKEKRLYPKGL